MRSSTTVGFCGIDRQRFRPCRGFDRFLLVPRGSRPRLQGCRRSAANVCSLQVKQRSTGARYSPGPARWTALCTLHGIVRRPPFEPPLQTFRRIQSYRLATPVHLAPSGWTRLTTHLQPPAGAAAGACGTGVRYFGFGPAFSPRNCGTSQSSPSRLSRRRSSASSFVWPRMPIRPR